VVTSPHSAATICVSSSLVRGFASGGIGPRDISTGQSNNSTASLGGTTYFGGSLELQFPIFGLPREIGLRGAIFADAGTLFGYKGRKNFAGEVFNCGQDPLPAGNPCFPGVGGALPTNPQSNTLRVRDDSGIRSSVGASLLWASPLGPIRFDYAFALTKDEGELVGLKRVGGDVTQAFRFSGGTSF
jgi:outer membrane protein insertion porin family